MASSTTSSAPVPAPVPAAAGAGASAGAGGTTSGVDDMDRKKHIAMSMESLLNADISLSTFNDLTNKFLNTLCATWPEDAIVHTMRTKFVNGTEGAPTAKARTAYLTTARMLVGEAVAPYLHAIQTRDVATLRKCMLFTRLGALEKMESLYDEDADVMWKIVIDYASHALIGSMGEAMEVLRDIPSLKKLFHDLAQRFLPSDDGSVVRSPQQLDIKTVIMTLFTTISTMNLKETNSKLTPRVIAQLVRLIQLMLAGSAGGASAAEGASGGSLGALTPFLEELRELEDVDDDEEEEGEVEEATDALSAAKLSASTA